MNPTGDDVVAALREALEVSPDNVPLRRQLAVMWMRRGQLDQAEAVLREGLGVTPASELLKLALAECFARQGKDSEALVLLEERASLPGVTGATLIQFARLLLKVGDLNQAALIYRRAIEAEPELADHDLADALGLTPASAERDERRETDEMDRIRVVAEPSLPESFAPMERPAIDFDDVGGMDGLKEEIRLKIIAPLENAELYAAYGKTVGGGILMYGPPGCGKTHLARATAGQIKAGFIAVGIHDILDMYMGEGEKRLHALFEHARANAPCVLFFDEADALGAKRSDMRSGAWSRTVNQFLAELDGAQSRNDGLLVLAATNAPWSLDPAFRRPGRFDRIIFVPPPDPAAAVDILRVQLKDKPQDIIDAAAVAKNCKSFSGADLKAVVDRAIEAKLAEALKSGVPAPLTTRDLIAAAQLTRPTTAEWFASARNHALYANEAGQYDDVLRYLKRK